jgi:disulfide bond formation protein DsbB
MTPNVAHYLNALGLSLIGVVLLFAFGDQLLRHDLPCPLCLLQRAGMVAAGFGIALNLALGPSPAFYGLASLGALCGAAVAIRQILLHIVPGTGAYGDAFFGLHFYSWAFIVFAAIVAGASVMLLFTGQFQQERRGLGPLARRLGAAAFLIFGLLAVANGFSTVLQCGAGLCPENPTGYLLLQAR